MSFPVFSITVRYDEDLIGVIGNKCDGGDLIPGITDDTVTIRSDGRSIYFTVRNEADIPTRQIAGLGNPLVWDGKHLTQKTCGWGGCKYEDASQYLPYVLDYLSCAIASTDNLAERAIFQQVRAAIQG